MKENGKVWSLRRWEKKDWNKHCERK